VELFVFVIESPVMNTLGSRLESLGKAIFKTSNLQSIFRMIFPFKIVVCSLKSVKRLPGVQNDSQVMNTPGVNFLLHLKQASEKVYKTFPVTKRPGIKDSPVY
jgi:hypothetical protein